MVMFEIRPKQGFVVEMLQQPLLYQQPALPPVPSSCRGCQVAQGQAPSGRHPTFDQGQVGFALWLPAPTSVGHSQWAARAGLFGGSGASGRSVAGESRFGLDVASTEHFKYSRVVTLS